jgi:hypothetical protein
VNALEQLTDEGQHALLRYRQRQDQMDLHAAIQTFEVFGRRPDVMSQLCFPGREESHADFFKRRIQDDI